VHEIVFILASVMLGIPVGIFVLVAAQGALRDRWRRQYVARELARSDVLLVNTRRLLVADPSHPPQVLAATVVRCLDDSRHALAIFRTKLGGEVPSLTRSALLARDEAAVRLQDQARALGFDAVQNIRYETSQVMPLTVEVFAYGTGIVRLGESLSPIA
jgi:uncharacterized protein YbjQ (UPF0145 family)